MKEISLLKIKWCEIANCPQGLNSPGDRRCGIVKRLVKLPEGKPRKEERNWLLGLTTEELQQLCMESLHNY